MSLVTEGYITYPKLTWVDGDCIEALTPRELDVLRLLASGLTRAQIAARLDMGVPRVGKHIKTMMDKTYAPTGYALAVYAWRNGIISIEDAWATLQAHNQNTMIEATP